MPIVHFDKVTVWTPERKLILDDISWSAAAGEHWVILGPNGAGKTTMLSIVGAERHPSQGTATVLGETLGRVDMRALRGRIGRVDPNQRMLDWVTGSEAVLTGLTGTIWPRWQDWGDAEFERSLNLLKLMGCEEYATREVGTLSAGERQRIRIARALISDPDLLLLDEPATGLDFPAREALLRAIDELAERRPELPTVMVSHHLEDLPTSVTHVLLMRDGRVLATGAVDAMLTSEHVSACFGFPVDVHRFDERWTARASAGWTMNDR
ncbi:MAG: ATP-binding cassette domain-containing protein [Thermomicrobiales bacterium]